MLKHDAVKGRPLRTETLKADLIIVGGGVAGACCAVTAARAGARVILVQDRPVLGGNASSEVRLWILGATAHMGNNNRWAREGGVIDEILVENAFRNPEGNPIILDALLLEKVACEANVTLLLNTATYDLRLLADGAIDSIRAFCSQNSTCYELQAPLYCDASGDGILGFLAGGAFRMGAEGQMEFGELLASDEPRHELLGHSIYFYTRDVGRPVRFVPPGYALDDVTKIPHYRRFNAQEHGCQLWWIEYGGHLDTVHETERIKWELWRIVYGVWNYIKNSGNFPEAEKLTLEWVGQIPGKRESRRFEGDYMLMQQDVVEQRTHYDAVSYGGWAIDLHPVDGVYGAQEPCAQWHSKGVYQIPYRTMYSRNVPNLFLTGRIISASHIAFGSTRVMATCAHNGQAVGMAAAICRQKGWQPRALAHPARIGQLQQALLRSGQYIPGVRRSGLADLAQQAQVTASSQTRLSELEPSGRWRKLDESQALLLPIAAGMMPRITLRARARVKTALMAELRVSSRDGNFTPDVVLGRLEMPVHVAANDERGGATRASRRDASDDLADGSRDSNGFGDAVAVAARPHVKALAEWRGASVMDEETLVELAFDCRFAKDAYAFVCLEANLDVEVAVSDRLVTGVTSLFHQRNARVSKGMVQRPPKGVGIDVCEFWTPQRRPEGKNLAVQINPPLESFGPENAVNGIGRPTTAPNAWVAAWDDPQPSLCLRWTEQFLIARVELVFDTDFDHALESVLMMHSEATMPYCVRNVRLRGYGGQLLADRRDNHQTRMAIELSPPVRTNELTIEIDTPELHVPASLFEVQCYGPSNDRSNFD